MRLLAKDVSKGTHLGGHILDLIISRDKDLLDVSGISVDDLISDHHLVSCNIAFPTHIKQTRTITYRDTKSIDIAEFRSSILESLKSFSKLFRT